VRRAAVAFIVLSACVAGGREDGQAAPTGQADRFSPLEGEPSTEVLRLLPEGIPASALRLGNDGCYYHETGGRAVALRFPGNAVDHYCIG